MNELNYDCLPTRSTQQVRMPSDGVDPSRLNGPCRTYRLNAPMGLSQLEAMPSDLQRIYLQRLQQHGGSEEAVLRMLHAKPEQMTALLTRHHIVFDQPNPTAWSAFLQQ